MQTFILCCNIMADQHSFQRRLRFWVVFFLWQYWFAVGFFAIGLMLWAASAAGWIGYAAIAVALVAYYASISGSKAHKTSKGDNPDSRIHDTFSEDFANYFGGMPVGLQKEYSALLVRSKVPACADNLSERCRIFC